MIFASPFINGGGLMFVGPLVSDMGMGGGGGNGGGGGALTGDVDLGGVGLGTGGGGGKSLLIDTGSGVAWCDCGLLERVVLSFRVSIWRGKAPFGGDMTASGGGGGGGSVSRPVDMLRPLVGVLEAEGVELLLGGAGGGTFGRVLFAWLRVGVPAIKKNS